jgi:hypothetical protein
MKIELNKVHLVLVITGLLLTAAWYGVGTVQAVLQHVEVSDQRHTFEDLADLQKYERHMIEMWGGTGNMDDGILTEYIALQGKINIIKVELGLISGD